MQLLNLAKYTGKSNKDTRFNLFLAKIRSHEIQLMVDNFAITEVNELKNIYITVFRYLYRNVKTKA